MSSTSTTVRRSLQSRRSASTMPSIVGSGRRRMSEEAAVDARRLSARSERGELDEAGRRRIWMTSDPLASLRRTISSTRVDFPIPASPTMRPDRNEVALIVSARNRSTTSISRLRPTKGRVPWLRKLVSMACELRTSLRFGIKAAVPGDFRRFEKLFSNCPSSLSEPSEVANTLVSTN